MSKGCYFVGCPALTGGFDALAALRGTENLLMDMIKRPGWIKQRLKELLRAYRDVYDRLYELIKMDDGGMAYRDFCLWAPAKVAEVQCDAAAMISPAMFKEFVVPDLASYCGWLDYSLFHLDGTQCIVHLDHLLEIDSLDAIEWTPQSWLPGGADKQWHEMYKRILNAGKSVQIVGVTPDEIIPLLDAVGTEGIYILSDFSNEDECEKITKKLDRYR